MKLCGQRGMQETVAKRTEDFLEAMKEADDLQIRLANTDNELVATQRLLREEVAKRNGLQRPAQLDAEHTDKGLLKRASDEALMIGTIKKPKGSRAAGASGSSSPAEGLNSNTLQFNYPALGSSDLATTSSSLPSADPVRAAGSSSDGSLVGAISPAAASGSRAPSRARRSTATPEPQFKTPALPRRTPS
ncbi:hypothetical protein HDV00_009654 [Rhizophlyctis rosea]|nr:hypothetical protein HDV00_009654 [Rhizophlyctis rosea]